MLPKTIRVKIFMLICKEAAQNFSLPSLCLHGNRKLDRHKKPCRNGVRVKDFKNLSQPSLCLHGNHKLNMHKKPCRNGVEDERI